MKKYLENDDDVEILETWKDLKEYLTFRAKHDEWVQLFINELAAIGIPNHFYGFYAVIIGLILTLPYTAYMKITKKEHVYPLIPFLTTGYIIILIILTVQGQSISWLL